ncbi:MAG: DUF488 domain-containing protein [Rhizobiaceae bacterium]|nr:DUF488 domain-containing protein [Rhizobiaceae bacterium]
MKLQIKRVYEQPAREDGLRVLVDRLWPRGLAKQDADVDLWLKDIAPSTGLRRWFGHDPRKWTEFRHRYRAELDANRMAVETLRERGGSGTVTLLYAARDQQHNQAVVLKDFLDKAE